ncbi:MAG TPA: IS91 family transposase [Candidatus Baltobacteraceae bacterium]|nr:IS91 family transposase [Candidatus Baltobacteraceae bacterium]HVO22867.1 IS91 family transposase [Candidatus Margulisiibacteriota bacterium]
MHAHPQPGAPPPFEINAILRQHGRAFRSHNTLSAEQLRVLDDLDRCRTPALGSHLYRCQQCAAEVVLHDSCLNRHCPSCQGPAQIRWVEQRKQRLLATHYFHLVFTLPAQLRPLAQRCPRQLFNLLFAAAAHTLLDLARDPNRLGATLGFSLVLHTWKRDLNFHPHVHGIVSGGGFDAHANRWVAAAPHYLFPGKVLSALFRGKFLSGLIDLYQTGTLADAGLDQPAFRQLITTLRTLDWLVYAKQPFGGPEQIVRYLGLYTHRVAISNARLLDVRDDLITFRTRGAGTCSIAPHEFIRRFLLHVLPDRFVKIRHYGLLAPANVNTQLKRAQHLLAAQLPATDTTDASPSHHPTADPQPSTDDSRPRCPYCGARALIRLAATARRPRRARPGGPPPDT